MPRSKAGRSAAKILRSEIIYKGPVFGVRRDEVVEPGGVRAVREVITHPGSGGASGVAGWADSADPAISLRYSAIFVGAGGWAH